jgi:CheY-like chemotaxis protein
MRVLVVDDEVSLCSSLAELLRREGFEVTEAYDGFRALELATTEGANISAVLSDINMPGMDGIEMWDRMKPLLPSDCKILFMSGLAQKKLQEDMIFAGDLLQKPFSLDRLLQKLRTIAD